MMISNPIYGKGRYDPKFKLGDRVKVIRNGSKYFGQTGYVVYQYRTPNQKGYDKFYIVDIDDQAVDVAEEDIQHSFSENPVYDKKREPEGDINVGDLVVVKTGHYTGLTGKVVQVATGAGRRYYWVDLRTSELIASPLLFREGEVRKIDAPQRGVDPSPGFTSNPIYGKSRYGGPKFNVGDRVKVVSEGSAYFGKTGFVVYRYDKYPSQEYGVTDQGFFYMVEIDGDDAYFYESSLEPAFTSNPVYHKGRPRFQVGDTVRNTITGQIGDVRRVKTFDEGDVAYEVAVSTKSGVFYVLWFDGEVVRSYESNSDYQYLSNPVYQKKRPAPKFKPGDFVRLTHPDDTNKRYYGMPGIIAEIKEVSTIGLLFSTFVYGINFTNRDGTKKLGYGTWAYDFELSPAKKGESFSRITMDTNPIYPKRRFKPVPKFKLNDPVAFQKGGKILLGKIGGIHNGEQHGSSEKFVYDVYVASLDRDFYNIGESKLHLQPTGFYYQNMRSGDRVRIVGTLYDGMIATVNSFENTAMGMRVLVDLPSGTVSLPVTSVRKEGYAENPIYPKGRPNFPHFTEGTYVQVIDDASQYWGEYGKIIKARKIMGNMVLYDVEFKTSTGWVVSTFFRSQLADPYAP